MAEEHLFFRVIKPFPAAPDGRTALQYEPGGEDDYYKLPARMVRNLEAQGKVEIVQIEETVVTPPKTRAKAPQKHEVRPVSDASNDDAVDEKPKAPAKRRRKRVKDGAPENKASAPTETKGEAK